MLRPVYALAALAVVALLAFAACNGGGNDDDSGNGTGRSGPLKVVTTVAPITSLVENIGGTKIDLQGLIPEGVNSHTYEPPVSDVRVLADAELIIINGLNLQEP